MMSNVRLNCSNNVKSPSLFNNLKIKISELLRFENISLKKQNKKTPLFVIGERVGIGTISCIIEI